MHVHDSIPTNLIGVHAFAVYGVCHSLAAASLSPTLPYLRTTFTPHTSLSLSHI